MLSVANNTPSISIIMPAYNSRSTIGESIQSVVNQTFSDWELLIIDDCSPESMKDIAESFHDERIRYIRLLKTAASQRPAIPVLCRQKAAISPSLTAMIFGCRKNWKSRFNSWKSITMLLPIPGIVNLQRSHPNLFGW